VQGRVVEITILSRIPTTSQIFPAHPQDGSRLLVKEPIRFLGAKEILLTALVIPQRRDGRNVPFDAH